MSCVCAACELRVMRACAAVFCVYAACAAWCSGYRCMMR